MRSNQRWQDPLMYDSTGEPVQCRLPIEHPEQTSADGDAWMGASDARSDSDRGSHRVVRPRPVDAGADSDGKDSRGWGWAEVMSGFWVGACFGYVWGFLS